MFHLGHLHTMSSCPSWVLLDLRGLKNKGEGTQCIILGLEACFQGLSRTTTTQRTGILHTADIQNNAFDSCIMKLEMDILNLVIITKNTSWSVDKLYVIGQIVEIIE